MLFTPAVPPTVTGVPPVVVDADRISMYSRPSPELLAAVVLARRDGKVHRAGPYRGLAGQVRLDYVAPLSAVSGPTPFIVLQVDPADWLYPMLQAWPTPSASGETLLFQRDGDQALFLNELRHRKDTALNFRMPLARHDLASATTGRPQSRAVEYRTDEARSHQWYCLMSRTTREWGILASLAASFANLALR